VIHVEFRSGVTVLGPAEIEIAVAEARDVGLPVFVISTGAHGEGEAFFSAVRAVLPLDPPLKSSRSWDALADSLWEGIRLLDSETAVIVWPDSWQFKNANPRDYDVAIAILDDVSRSLRNPVVTGGRPKAVSILLGASS
jgi:Barstar (barnase inhibitor)